MKHILPFFFFLITTSVIGQSWEPVASLPETASIRHHPITFSIGGVGYLVAGTKPSVGVLKDFYSYDPDTDSWTVLPDFPGSARGYSYGVTTDTKGYLGFGYFENEETFEGTALSDLWEYDPETEVWTELASCPCAARYHPAMVQVNDKIYVGLGGSDFGDLDDWWEYDIATDTWSEKTDFPSTERHHPYYFAIGDFVYVGFGHHESTIFNDFYRYDPSTDSWTTMATLPEQGRVAGTQFSYEGKGYILSGQGETHTNLPTGEFWEYDPDADDWTELTAHPGGGRWAPGSFLIDDEIFFTCGQANTGEKRDMMVFNLSPLAGLAEEKPLNQIRLYPNPSNGLVTISADSPFENADIFDSSGRLLSSINLTGNSINLENLNPGIYTIRLTAGDLVKTERIVLQ